MASLLSDAGLSVVAGVARFEDLGYISIVSDESAAKKHPHSIIRDWDSGIFGHYDVFEDDKLMSWDTVAATLARQPLEQALFLGVNGEVACIGSGDQHLERVIGGKSSKKYSFRGIGTVADDVYAVGMGPIAYLRESPNKWKKMKIESQSRKQDHVRGFEAIDGYGPNELYAVGWEGEIWSYMGASWKLEASPTNLILYDLCATPEDEVFACGQAGTIIQGRGSIWEVIEIDEFDDDFWGVEWFQGKLYLATLDALYCYDGESIEWVDMKLEGSFSGYQLSVNDGVMWSIGGNDVLMYDGTSWTRIE